MMVVFYFMLIRPQKRRADQHRALMESLTVGDEVVTIGGMFGTVRRLDESELELEVAPGTTLRLLRSAVARRITEDVEGPAEEGDVSTEVQAAPEDDRP